jgi:hypothetical protein
MSNAPLRLQEVPDEEYLSHLDTVSRADSFRYAVVYADSEIEYVHDEVDLEPLLDLIAAAQIDIIMVVISLPDDDSGSQTTDGPEGLVYSDICVDDDDQDDDDDADGEVEAVEADDQVEVENEGEAEDEETNPVLVMAEVCQ